MITQPQWQMWWFPDKMNMSNSSFWSVAHSQEPIEPVPRHLSLSYVK